MLLYMDLFLHALLLLSDNSPKCMLHQQQHVFSKLSTNRKHLVYAMSKNSLKQPVPFSLPFRLRKVSSGRFSTGRFPGETQSVVMTQEPALLSFSMESIFCSASSWIKQKITVLLMV